MNLSIPLSVKKTEDGKVKAWSLLVSGSYAKLSHKDYAAQLFPGSNAERSDWVAAYKTIRRKMEHDDYGDCRCLY